MAEKDNELGIVVPNVCHKKQSEVNLIIIFEYFWKYWISVIHKQDIKQYLIDKNATSILDENERGTLTETSRRLLIRHLNNYQKERFGLNANNAQKNAIATAASCTFTTLRAVIK